MTMALALSQPPRQVSALRRACARLLGRMPLPELAQTCDVSICVPVSDERVDRLRAQIAAFARQTFPRERFELVYVVNNDRPDGSSRRTRAIRANARILRFLRGTHPVTVRVIDRSSPGREIPGCTVGHARNVGLHAVAARYLSQQRDGIVIQTDADTFPRSARYLAAVWEDMKRSGVAAAAGGLSMVLDMDAVQPAKRAYFRRHIRTLRDYSAWNHLVAALRAVDLTPRVSPTWFSGAHTVVRASVGVAAGGIPHEARGEDVVFGERIKTYARRCGLRVLPRRDRWLLETAIRESTRTGASFGPIFSNIAAHRGRPLVRNPEGSDLPSVPLTPAGLRALRRRVFRDPKRKAYAMNLINAFSRYALPRR